MRLVTTLLSFLCFISLTGCFAVAAGGAGAAGYAGVQERTIGAAVDDNVIQAEITSLFVQNDVNELMVKVGVEVNEGRVLLTGSVANPESRIEAVRLAWQPKGVKEVINEIQITDKTSLNDIAIDSWITTQISSKLLVEKGVKSINYTVETVNGVVYLLGLAQNNAELDKVTQIASKVKGVKRVVSHVRLVEDARRN